MSAGATGNPPPGEEIVMYSTAWCGGCRRAKRVFVALGVPFREVDIERDAEARARSCSG